MSRKLTTTTWSDLASTGLSGGAQIGWEKCADLARELHEKLPNLPEAAARTLVGQTSSGMPMVITWDTREGDQYSGYKIRRTTATVLVSQLFVPENVTDSYPGQAHIRYTGFGHPIYLNKIIDVHVPETTYTWTDVED